MFTHFLCSMVYFPSNFRVYGDEVDSNVSPLVKSLSETKIVVFLANMSYRPSIRSFQLEKNIFASTSWENISTAWTNTFVQIFRVEKKSIELRVCEVYNVREHEITQAVYWAKRVGGVLKMVNSITEDASFWKYRTSSRREAENK